MSTISLRLPESLHRQLRAFAEDEAISINQLITVAVAEKMSAIATESLLQARARRGSSEKLLRILEKVPSVPPAPEDQL